MKTASHIVAAPEVRAEAVVDRVALDLEGRRKRRHVVTTVGGGAVLIDLAEVPQLHDGDGLVLEDGGVVRVEALPEPLMEVSVHDPAQRVKVAWHLGNRHLAVQFVGEAIRLRRDHVIRAMLAGLGARVVDLEAPFDQEAGAYGHHHEGGHAHGHG
jgi:urease accessory protein